MKILLDTAAFLWMFFGEREKFSKKALKILEEEPPLFFSAVSGWEIAIKYSLGKLELKQPPKRWLDQAILEMGLLPLPISIRHTVEVSELPKHHKDPFDRLLIGQAKVEGMEILSPDPIFKEYRIASIW